MPGHEFATPSIAAARRGGSADCLAGGRGQAASHGAIPGVPAAGGGDRRSGYDGRSPGVAARLRVPAVPSPTGPHPAGPMADGPARPTDPAAAVHAAKLSSGWDHGVSDGRELSAATSGSVVDR